MPTERTLADAEQQWIAKYRAALSEVPVQQPRFARILTFIHRTKKVIAAKVGKVLAAEASARAASATLSAAASVSSAATAHESGDPAPKRARRQPANVKSSRKASRKRISAAAN
jgi:hypothetical protein